MPTSNFTKYSQSWRQEGQTISHLFPAKLKILIFCSKSTTSEQSIAISLHNVRFRQRWIRAIFFDIGMSFLNRIHIIYVDATFKTVPVDFLLLLIIHCFFYVFRYFFCHVLRVSWPSSGPEFCVIWPWKRPASGRGSLWESSSFVPWLVFNAFRDGSGVVPECPGSSGFIRKSSSRASAPRMRFSVLLNSFDSLFVTLPSISSKTWVI